MLLLVKPWTPRWEGVSLQLFFSIQTCCRVRQHASDQLEREVDGPVPQYIELTGITDKFVLLFLQIRRIHRPIVDFLVATEEVEWGGEQS